MNVHQAAKLLRYSERHIKRLAKEGKLPVKVVEVERIVTVKEYEFPDNLAEWFKDNCYVPYSKRKEVKHNS